MDALFWVMAFAGLAALIYFLCVKKKPPSDVAKLTLTLKVE